jgi:hypothetical protein
MKIIICRPAPASERIKVRANGDVVLNLKSAYRDGTPHRLKSRLGFLQRKSEGRTPE